jgi:hypothetical protein
MLEIQLESTKRDNDQLKADLDKMDKAISHAKLVEAELR